MTTYACLAEAPSNLLRKLAEQASDGNLPRPLNQRALAELNLEGLWPAVAVFREVSADALGALLLAVLSERNAGRTACASLVWTGPDVPHSPLRDTWMVMEELFTSAKHEVFIAGYTFDNGQKLFASLHETMAANKEVACKIIMDVRPPPPGRPLAKHLQETAFKFMQEIWRRGAPWPQLYYDTRTCAPKARISMHAKCIIVDHKRCLIGSANFTDRGQKRNTELGLLMDSETTAMQVMHQWGWLIANEAIKRLQ